MEDILEDDFTEKIKVGDIVRLKSANNHYGDYFKYDFLTTFTPDEIGSLITIEDIIYMPEFDNCAYQVQCKKGTTYLRRHAFKLLINRPKEEENICLYQEFLLNLLHKLDI